ncbi:hypothetical protein L3Y34_009498 [Caenorhabditis briggsae]|uniref:Nuclear receptor domain-containing protein n=1 Tax=Caenorhabditis briggsae TaxID=6238 RepID=A0AAE9AC80_CAEBR|nr:hypothetical protein L3Y34_009498 [Caenorhabditis briggsae]
MCPICGSNKSELHLGGVSCRACAAFFRRYFESPKMKKNCTCQKRTQKSHPCRKCRIDKCLEVGMTPKYLQGIRVLKCLQNVPSSSSSLNGGIISRATAKLDFAFRSWQDFKEMRDTRTKQGEKEWKNIYDITRMTQDDMNLVWNMVRDLFPTMRELGKSDGSAMLRNFILKNWQINPIFDEILENSEHYTLKDGDDYFQMVTSWYKGPFESEKEITFEPFWNHYLSNTAIPIFGLKLRKEELIAIVWLLFFDTAHTNISPECQEMCRNIKKVILRELKNYQADRNFHDMRFLDTVEILELVEKAEEKFMEHLMVCEMNHVRIHDDFKEILKENRL